MECKQIFPLQLKRPVFACAQQELCSIRFWPSLPTTTVWYIRRVVVRWESAIQKQDAFDKVVTTSPGPSQDLMCESLICWHTERLQKRRYWFQNKLSALNVTLLIHFSVILDSFRNQPTNADMFFNYIRVKGWEPAGLAPGFSVVYGLTDHYCHQRRYGGRHLISLYCL